MGKDLTLITGASAGIGYDLAQVFAEHGHGVLLVARRRDKLESLAAELRGRFKVRAECFAADLADPAGPAELYDAVTRAGHQVGILVNNAGIAVEGPFLEAKLDALQQLLAVNLLALVELSHRFGGAMRRRGSGRILNVCSTSAFQPVPGLACYAASKAFVLSLSEAMAIEAAADGVSVTALCPGFVKTDMTAKEGGGHIHLPGIPMLEPREVAEQGYRALMKGRPVYVNGLANQLVTSVSSSQPRWITRRIGKLIAKRGW